MLWWSSVTPLLCPLPVLPAEVMLSDLDRLNSMAEPWWELPPYKKGSTVWNETLLQLSVNTRGVPAERGLANDMLQVSFLAKAVLYTSKQILALAQRGRSTNGTFHVRTFSSEGTGVKGPRKWIRLPGKGTQQPKRNRNPSFSGTTPMW